MPCSSPPPSTSSIYQHSDMLGFWSRTRTPDLASNCFTSPHLISVPQQQSPLPKLSPLPVASPADAGYSLSQGSPCQGTTKRGWQHCNRGMCHHCNRGSSLAAASHPPPHK